MPLSVRSILGNVGCASKPLYLFRCFQFPMSHENHICLQPLGAGQVAWLWQILASKLGEEGFLSRCKERGYFVIVSYVSFLYLRMMICWRVGRTRIGAIRFDELICHRDLLLDGRCIKNLVQSVAYRVIDLFDLRSFS